jgi:dTDP-4-dehydrorhamnose reductase
MKIAVIGSSGQLGTDLCKTLDNEEIVPLTHADIEITDFKSVNNELGKHKPDVIINTAAYVRVDDCEDNRDQAFNVNALGARNVAVVAQKLNAKLVHISTDYIFGGRKEHSIPCTEFDTPEPINIYGQSKLAGEDFVRHLCNKYFIVRSSGLFGVAGSSGKGGNFVETMLRLGKERSELKVVNDQVLSPTYTKDLANKIAELIKTDFYGIFHITNSGSCSWYEFTMEILRIAGLKAKVIPINSSEYPQKALRPAYSVLDNYHLRLLNMNDMRRWQEGLGFYMVERS